ncbi:MAG: cation diffusion facilitator family transporter [Candidatus Endonucleobacter bathymodioli]|uniref:Cation diffusion facilitator family transporter n=1 Tax=Candidatus Endonucleibacter bathymodioli TaxID=539814 RepID=A0AA90NR27_9GAMM|nr:cation diffusion facilitator family transporter [Candidatus Endonucleobacter bathymodioli]
MSHDHSHKIDNYNRAFAIGVVLNLVFVVIEAVCGVFASSLSLLADAGHNLSDVVSLLLAWGANVLATKYATEKRTYGFKKVTIMASLLSAVLLIFVLGGIAWEAVVRFQNPQPADGMTVIVVAAIGAIINTFTALLFVKGQKHDLNIRGAFLHMAADAGVSLGVVIAGIFIMMKGWLWIDPVISIFITVVIAVGTWRLLLDSINYAIDAVPQSISIAEIRKYLLSYDHVDRMHDLHVWPLSTTEVALTVHLVINEDLLDNDFIWRIQKHLHDHFGIEHSTIQVENSTGNNNCLLNSSKCL